MLRWGSRENHSYVLGAYTDVQKAYEAGEREAANRGGKYEYEIVDLTINKDRGPDKYLLSFDGPCSAKCKYDCQLKDMVNKK